MGNPHDDGSVFLPQAVMCEAIPLEHSAPQVQPPPLSLSYEIAPAVNVLQYVDHSGFCTKFGNELEAIGQVENMVEVGRGLLNTLYTYRAVGKAIPLDVSEQSEEFNLATFEILRNEIVKLVQLMDYQELAISVFIQHVGTIASAVSGKKKIVPEMLYDAMVSAVDVLQMIDKLKDMKACLTNDFTRYKRALVVVRESLDSTVADELDQEQQRLQLFLNNPKHSKNFIMYSLKRKCDAVPDSQDVLCRMLQRSVDTLAAEAYLIPTDKYTLLRAIPHLLWLMDGTDDSDTSFNAFKNKKIKLNGVQKLLQRYPVVPEFGDMTVTLAHVLENAPHFDEESMSHAYGVNVDSKAVENYSVITHLNSTVEEFGDFTTQLASELNELADEVFSKDNTAMKDCHVVAETVLRGLTLLGKWSCLLREALAWKFTHPIEEQIPPSTGHNNQKSRQTEVASQPAYARALRLNFTTRELGAVAEIVTMIKMLAGMIGQSEARLAPYLRLHIYLTTQQLVQGTLVPVLHRADKKKRGVLVHLLELRTMAADYAGLAGSAEDYKQYKRAQGAVDAKLYPRVVAPSYTQLQLLRTMVRGFYDEDSELRQSTGALNREDLKKKDLEALREFYEASFFFPYLLNLSGTLKDLSDLGDIWFREFHLELSNRIQFPIELSFPWILTEYIVHPEAVDRNLLLNKPKQWKRKSKKGGMTAVGRILVPQVLYILDLYNDAAQRALYEFNSQYMFNEIQAEVNLAYDQLVFHLETGIYSFYKDWAASTVLDKLWKHCIEARKGWGWYTPEAERWQYEVLLQQRHVLLLGRSVDLNLRFSLGINRKVQADLELVIKQFESGGLSGIVELESNIAVIRKTHSLLCSAGLCLDSWESIYGDVVEISSTSTVRGRIGTHVLNTVLFDLFSNYRFCSATQRFARSQLQVKNVTFLSRPQTMDKTLGTGEMCSKAFEQIYAGTRNFVGEEHYSSMCRVLSCTELPLVIEAAIQRTIYIVSSIKEWTDVLMPVIPSMLLKRFSGDGSHCFSYFEKVLTDFLPYEHQMGIFQDFTEFGNALSFLQCAGCTLAANDNFKFIDVLPMVGLPISRSYSKDTTRVVSGVKVAAAVLKDSPKVSSSVVNIMEGTVQEVYRAQEKAIGFSRGRNLITTVFTRVDTALDELGARASWKGGEPSNGVINVESTDMFHGLYSVLNFLFCRVEPSSAVSHFDQFGDGFTMACVTIIHILGQRQQFELLDFSRQVLDMRAYFCNDSISKEEDHFVELAEFQNQLQMQFFEELHGLFPSQEHKHQKVTIFHPPADDTTLVSPLYDMSSSGLAATQPTKELPGIPCDMEIKASPTTSLFKGAVGKMRGPRKGSANPSSHSQKLSVDQLFNILGGQDHTDDDSDIDISGAPKPNSLLDPFASTEDSSSKSSSRFETPQRKRLDYSTYDHEKIEKICDMGFSRAETEQALNSADGDLFGALEQLVIASDDKKRTPLERSRNYTPSKSMDTATTSSAAADGEKNFGPVPVLTPIKSMGMADFPVVSSSGKKDVISGLDPDKVKSYKFQERVEIDPLQVETARGVQVVPSNNLSVGKQMQKKAQNVPGGAPTSHQQLQNTAVDGGSMPQQMAPRPSYMPPRPQQAPAKQMIGPGGSIRPAKPTKRAPIGGGLPLPSNQSSPPRPSALQMGPRQASGPRPRLVEAGGSANHFGVMAPGPQQQQQQGIQQPHVDRTQQVAVPQQAQYQGLVPQIMAAVPLQSKGAMAPPQQQQQQGNMINAQIKTEAPQQLQQQNIQYMARPPPLGQQPQPLQQQGGVSHPPVRPPLLVQQPQPLQQQRGVSQPVRPPLLVQQPQPLQQQRGVSQPPVRPQLLGQQPQPVQQQGGVSQPPVRPPLLVQQPQPLRQQRGVSQPPVRPQLLVQQPQPLQQQGGVSQPLARPPLLVQQPQPLQQQRGVSQPPVRPPLLAQQPQPLQQQRGVSQPPVRPQLLGQQPQPVQQQGESSQMMGRQFQHQSPMQQPQPQAYYGQQVQPDYTRRGSGSVSRAGMISAMDQLPGPQPQQPGSMYRARKTSK